MMERGDKIKAGAWRKANPTLARVIRELAAQIRERGREQMPKV